MLVLASSDSVARPRTCQWIEGDVRPGVRPAFCGQPALPGCAWCGEHRLRAYAHPADPNLAGIDLRKVPA